MQHIISWNVASVRARLPLLTSVLKAYRPDILFLQEIKATDSTFPFQEIENMGYYAYIKGQKALNGVAILSKTPLTVLNHFTEPDSLQARFIEACDSNNIHYISVYIPNGNPPLNNPDDTSRLQYKLAWMDSFYRYIHQNENEKFIIGGDFNVIEKETDVYNPKYFKNTALMDPNVLKSYAKIKTLPLIDSLRYLTNEEHIYSFWDFQMQAFKKNYGILLDKIFISNALAPTIQKAGVYQEIRGQEKPSDHAPIYCLLKD